MGEICKWVMDEEGVWNTECGNRLQIMEGTLQENQMLFCPYCGKNLEDATKVNDGTTTQGKNYITFSIRALQINPTTGCPQVNPKGPSRKFHSLEDAAKFVVAAYFADNTWFGLVDDLVDPPEEHDNVLAVLRFAVYATEIHPNDWPATVARCISWMEYERNN